jgi:thioredoxin reductase (NADPH)
VAYRKLDVPGTARLDGAGVSYGSAMTEAFACKNEDVYIAGGANSAGQAAVLLANSARTVTMLVRGASLAASMSSYLVDQIGQLPNVRVRLGSQVVEVHGAQRLEAISVRGPDGVVELLPAAALFVFIGAQTRTEWLDGVVARDRQGFLLTGADLMPGGTRSEGWSADRDPYPLETSMPGIFAAGDVRHGSVKRVASGVGEGSMVVAFVHQYLAEG